MAAKAILVFYAQALLFQVALSQCVYPGAQYLPTLTAPAAGISSCGGLINSGPVSAAGVAIGNACAGAGLSAASIQMTPTSGGGLPVTSASSITPTGLSVTSENDFKGSLLVAGELPFISAVALEGVVPSAGAGVVSYGCGNGITSITSNAGNFAGVVAAGSAGTGLGVISPGIAAVSPGIVGPGLIGGCRCGCGGY